MTYDPDDQTFQAFMAGARSLASPNTQLSGLFARDTWTAYVEWLGK